MNYIFLLLLVFILVRRESSILVEFFKLRLTLHTNNTVYVLLVKR